MIFLFENFFQKVLQSQNRRFCAWASGSGFGAPICVAVVCNSFVFRNSVSADRSGMMAASRFLAAAAVCVILLSFAAWNHKSYCTGWTKVANVFGNLPFGADDFPFKFLFKSASKS
jgi:hypothetical protein